MKNAEIVKLKGIEYKIRTIEVRDEIENQVIKSKIRVASMELNKSYDEDKMSILGSKEQKIDASIDHYVTNEMLNNLPDVVVGSEVEELMLDIMACTEEMVEIESW